jgi:transaldolase
MQFFLDTANIREIQKAAEIGVLDGVTTNPSLVARENRKHDELLKEICSIVEGPVSAEVLSEDKKGIIKEARRLAKIAGNIVVKVPVCMEGLKATRALSDDGIKVNMTLIFSSTQAILAAKAGAAYVSPFVGRLDDHSHYGMESVEQIVQIYENYGFPAEIIVASIRNPMHVVEAALMGADIATVPFKVFEQIVRHPLTDVGIKRFLEDGKKIPKK